MAYSRYSITVYIADKGASTLDEGGKAGTSKTGHMWLSLDDNEKGLVQPYGFHPSTDGRPFTFTGKVKTNDNYTYQQVGDKKTFPITKGEYEKLLNICEEGKSKNTFGSYVGTSNACVDFVWEVLGNVGIGKSLLFNDGILKVNPEREGHIWPSDNKYLIDAAWNFHMRYVVPSQVSGAVEDHVSRQNDFVKSITPDNSIGKNLINTDSANIKSDEIATVPALNTFTFNMSEIDNNSQLVPTQKINSDFPSILNTPFGNFINKGLDIFKLNNILPPPEQQQRDMGNIAYLDQQGEAFINGSYSDNFILKSGDKLFKTERYIGDIV